MHQDHLSLARTALAKRSKSGFLQSKGLEKWLAGQLDIPVMEARGILFELRDSGEVSAADWDPRTGPVGRVTLNLRLNESPSLVMWRDALVAAGVGAADVAALEPAHRALDKMCLGDLQRVASGLIRLRAGGKGLSGESRFGVSARYLIESSKLLDALPNAALRAFGIEVNDFPDAPGYVLTAGPENPRAVVLVENPQSFEAAVKAAPEGVAWVATFGYGLSRSGDAFGNQLAGLIESGRMIQLVRSGSPPDLRRLLGHESLFFWGDLDPAGLHIFHRLRGACPQLQLSRLYQPMLDLLKAGGGHPYTGATGKIGQSPWVSDDPLIAELMEECGQRGVDQEVLMVSDIVDSAAMELDL